MVRWGGDEKQTPADPVSLIIGGSTLNATLDRLHVPEPRDVWIWIRLLPERLIRYWRAPAHLAFWSVIVLALLLRLGHLELIAFGKPAATQLASSAAFLNNHVLPLHGEIGTDGITQPALVTYLYAIPLLLGHDPRLAVDWTVLLNVCAIALSYACVRRWFGLRTALFTTLLWAVSPWAILQARTIGPSAYAPVWCALLLYGLVQGLQEPRSPGWLLAWLSVGLLVNTSIHYWPAVLFLSVLSLIYWRHVHWPAVLAGIGLSVLLLLPYLYYQSYVNFQDIAVIVQPIGSAGAQALWGWQALFEAMRFFSGLGLADLAGSTRAAYLSQRLPLDFIEGASAVVFLVSLPLCLAWMIKLITRWRERAQAPGYVTVVLWMLVTLLALAFQAVGPGKADLSLITPFGFIILGLALAALFRLVVNFTEGPVVFILLVRGVVTVAIAALCFWPVYASLNLYNYLNKTSIIDGYGLPLRFWLQTASFTRQKLSIEANKTLYLTDDTSDGVGLDSGAILGYLMDGAAEIIPLCPDTGRCLMLPVGHSNLNLILQPAAETLALVKQLAGKELAYTTQPDKMYSSHLYLLPATSADETIALIPQRDLWSIDDGALLLGYSLPSAMPLDQTSYIATYWSFTDPDISEPIVSHGLATRVISPNDNAGEMRLTFGLDESYWRMDKVFVRWLPFQPPADGTNGTYRLQIAVYRIAGLSMNRTLNENTQEPGLAIELASVQAK